MSAAHTAVKVQIASGFQHHYIKGHHPAISPGVNLSSSRNQRTPGMGEILWDQQIGKPALTSKCVLRQDFQMYRMSEASTNREI